MVIFYGNDSADPTYNLRTKNMRILSIITLTSFTITLSMFSPLEESTPLLPVPFFPLDISNDISVT